MSPLTEGKEMARISNPYAQLRYLSLLSLTLGSVVFAADQSIQLAKGWNPIFLTVEPDSPDIETLLSGCSVEAVWTYENRFQANEFVADDNEVFQTLGWRVHVVGDITISDLFTMHGGRGYLIKANAPCALTIGGSPTTETLSWAPQEYTLLGPFVDAIAPPTYEHYFAPSSAHSSNDATVVAIPASGVTPLVTVDKPTISTAAGHAFWAFTPTFSKYSGPIEVLSEGKTGVDFPTGVFEQSISIRNLRKDNRTISLQLSIGAEIPMEYFDPMFHTVGAWRALGTAQVEFHTNDGSTPKSVRLRVLRANKPPGNYQQTISVSDSDGYFRLIHVAVGVEGQEGLWIGKARLFSVARGDPMNLGTAPEILIPLVVHNGVTGVVSLLRQVTVMWKDGTTDLDGNVIEPGRSVLVTSAGNPSLFKAGARRDGREFSFRTTSTILHEDVPLSGTFGGTLSTVVSISATHPLNPYMHRYHPDHGDPSVVPGGTGGYEITRFITLEFRQEDPRVENNPDFFNQVPGWGDTVVGGIYTETIRGLTSPADAPDDSKDITVQGHFYLQRVSRVGVLNDVEGGL